MDNFIKQIINELCIEKNIVQNEISYGWINELKKGNNVHYIIGKKFDLNSEVTNTIVNDKFATYDILRLNNVPVIEHKIIFNPKTRNSYYKNSFIEDAKKLLAQNGRIVVKANDSCQGKDVFICEDEIELIKIINKLFANKKDTLSVSPYIDIDYEYRCIFLNNNIIYVYKKEKPYVIGDGVNNLKKLIEIKEKKENVKIDIFKSINLNKIPSKNEKIVISWKHNLSNGASPIIIDKTDEYVDKVKNIAKEAGRVLNIKFASIDVSLTNKNEIFVMEVNGNVCMNKFGLSVPNGFEIVKNIYSNVIDTMFE